MKQVNNRRVLYVVCFLLGNSPASEFYMPTFRNNLFHLHRQVHLLVYEDETECFETSENRIQTPGNYPEENIRQVNNHSPETFFETHNAAKWIVLTRFDAKLLCFRRAEQEFILTDQRELIRHKATTIKYSECILCSVDRASRYNVCKKPA